MNANEQFSCRKILSIKQKYSKWMKPVLSLFLFLGFTLLTSCSAKKEFSYSSNPQFDVLYSKETNQSEVLITVYIDNSKSDADIGSLTFKCYFLDNNSNIIDTQVNTYNVAIGKKTEGNYIFIFDSVKGKPYGIKLINTDSSYNKTTGETIREWLSKFWWVIAIITAYIIISIFIGLLWGSFLVTGFDLTDPAFWLSFGCGLIWPISWVILLILYFKY